MAGLARVCGMLSALAQFAAIEAAAERKKQDALALAQRQPVRSSVSFEDAPAGHAAWTKVKFQAHNQGHLWFFKREFHFQVTVGMSCNLPDEAGRICRLCYLKAEAGASKTELVEYRNILLKELAEVVKREHINNSSEVVKPASKPSQELAPKRRRVDGAIGSSWASQLGTKTSRVKNSFDPLADL